MPLPCSHRNKTGSGKAKCTAMTRSAPGTIGGTGNWTRRKAVERRVPEVREIPFSEWLAHMPARELLEQDPA